ncbi:MAG: thiamine pyrophosphate-binding protein [Burkholderiales bacterium]|jgi:acetolactate synthase-1/2/3 large subunit|nr:thiamine pyrophosphate-binding protein [Burkholderiales bacterium]
MSEVMAATRMTGGFVLARMLQAHGCGPIFGMAGFQLLPFYEGVRSLGMTHVLINDERTGVFAADAWARVTGRPGTCDATLGPGATNLVTGLVEALNAGTPMVVLAGNANRAHAGKNMTQEGRQNEILAPACKALLRIESPERIPEMVRRAYFIATSGRPGPVVLDVPEDVCHAEVAFTAAHLHAASAQSIPALRARPDVASLERAAQLIRSSRRPILLAGGGVHLSGAHQALTAFAEAQGVPVAHTISGKGAIACTHELAVGLFGRYSRIANDLIQRSDCIIAVGCKLGEIATRRYGLLPPEVPLIHIDNVAEEFGRTTVPRVALWCDAREALEDLRAALADDRSAVRLARFDLKAEIATRLQTWREQSAARLGSAARPIDTARLMHEVSESMPADSVLVADGGFAGHWSGLLYDTKKAGRGYIADRGFASIGYGLPGCIGAALAAGAAPVCGITGDGGFNMALGDLETARRLGANFTLVVINNAASGYVKALQHAMYGAGNYQSSDLVELDYAAIARDFKCRGERIEDPERLGAALRESLAWRGGPSILDVVVTRDPAQMLPAADSRTLKVEKGDRPA